MRVQWVAPVVYALIVSCSDLPGLLRVDFNVTSSKKETVVFIKRSLALAVRRLFHSTSLRLSSSVLKRQSAHRALGRERAAIVLHPVRAAGRWPNARLQPRAARSYLPRLLVHNSRAPASRADHVQGSRTTAVRGGIRARSPATGSRSKFITVRSQVSEPAASAVFAAARKWLGSRKDSPWPSA